MCHVFHHVRLHPHARLCTRLLLSTSFVTVNSLNGMKSAVLGRVDWSLFLMTVVALAPLNVCSVASTGSIALTLSPTGTVTNTSAVSRSLVVCLWCTVLCVTHFPSRLIYTPVL